MELHEEGLIEIFIQTHQQRLRNASQCLNEARKRQQITAPTENKTKITLANFSGVFYVSVIGYFISFSCFVRENVYYRMSECYNKLSYKKKTGQVKFGRRLTDESSNSKEEKGQTSSKAQDETEVFPYLE